MDGFNLFCFDNLTYQQAQRLCCAQYNFWKLFIIENGFKFSNEELKKMIETDFLSENDISEKVTDDFAKEKIRELRDDLYNDLINNVDCTLHIASFIRNHFNSKVEFANHVGVTKQKINDWINNNYIVCGNKIYSARRKIEE